MTTNDSKVSAQRDAEAVITMQRFYDHLESLLKRHRTIDYAPFASGVLKAALEAPDRSVSIAPHHVLHSIEANCRYTRGQNHDPVDRNRFIQVLNVYAEHEDPLNSGLISQSIDHLFRKLHREQIEPQYIHSRGDLVRDLRLFITNNPLPHLSNEFSRQNGLTIEEWLKLSFVTWIAANRDPRCCFTKEIVLSFDMLGVTPDRAEFFFDASSRTPVAIGERFQETRQSLKPQFHSLIRFIFLEAPIIDFGSGRMLAPQPSLILRHSGQGLYRLLRNLPHFDKEFGDSFERYVGNVVSSIKGSIRCLNKRDLERLSPGKSCDFLVEMSDSILLLEAKAATFTANLLTEKAIFNDNSTAKVATAIEQLYTTAYEIHNGDLKSLGIDTTKVIFGIVVTYGDLPLANSNWYFNTFFLKRAESKLKPPIYPSTAMEQLPIIMPIQVLELFAATITHLDASPTLLFDEKESQPYLKVGDWNTFLASKLRESNKKDLMLPFAQDQFVEFLVSLGFERDKAETI